MIINFIKETVMICGKTIDPNTSSSGNYITPPRPFQEKIFKIERVVHVKPPVVITRAKLCRLKKAICVSNDAARV